MPPEFLSLDEVLALHADQIRRYGGRAGVRDVTLLSAALTFLWLNGLRIGASEDELTELVMAVAAGKTGKPEIAVFLKQRVRRRR